MANIDGVQTGHSRRDLLKRAAVVGAVAWTAPMIISSPAFAASSQCVGSNRCTKFYGNTLSTTSPVGTFPVGNNGGCGSRPVSDLTCTTVTYPVAPVLEIGSIPYSAPAPDTYNGVAGESFTVTFPAGAIPLYFDLHLGGQTQNCNYFKWNATSGNFELDTSKPNNTNLCGLVITRLSTNPYTFKVFLATTRPSGCGGFSGSNVYYCS